MSWRVKSSAPHLSTFLARNPLLSPAFHYYLAFPFHYNGSVRQNRVIQAYLLFITTFGWNGFLDMQREG